MKRKILVLELWGLGDLTFSTVLLQGALQNGDEVHLVGKSHAQPLLQASYPAVRFFSLEAGWTKFQRKYYLWRWNWRAFWSLIGKLRRERYDIVVSTREDPRDHLLMALIGARRRVGFSHQGSGFLLTDAVKRSHGSGQHKVEDWRDLGEAIGLSGIRQLEPHLDGRAYRAGRIETLFKDLTLPVVVLHAGARIGVRRWPAAYFEKLIARLREKYRFCLILIPDPDGYGSELAPVSDIVLNDLALAELVDVIGRAHLLLCNDSGPSHLAASCGCPTVALFGPTQPSWFGPWGASHRIIRRDICPHRPCFDYCRFAEPYCMTRLTPETVWPEVEAHLRGLVEAGKMPREFVRPAPAGSSAAAEPLVVAVVATYCRPGEITRLLESFRSAATPMAAVVVDNADDPETAAAVADASRWMEVERVTPGRNLGCGGGLALAEKVALERFGDRMTHFLIMDDDALLTPGALERLLAALDETKAFMACPMAVDGEGNIGWFPGLLEQPVFDAVRKRKVRTPADYLAAFGTKPVAFSWSTGVALLVERGALEGAGMHRDDFLIRGEDLDFSLRMTAWGKGVFVPDALVQHFPLSGLPDSGPKNRGEDRRKDLILLQNLAYISVRLPHGRGILRTLPGNFFRYVRAWGLGRVGEAAAAYWRGGVLGLPAGRNGALSLRDKVLVFAHIPPPHHGQSFMVKLMLEGFGGDTRTAQVHQDREITCFHVNCRISADMEDIGSMRFGKIAQLLCYCVEAIKCRFQYGVKTLYYIPAPGKRYALYRDWIVMALCRPFFKNLVLHWHAVGLGEWLDDKGTWFERWVTQWLLGRPALSIALARASSLDAAWLRSRKVALVPNGIPDPCPGFDETIRPCRKVRFEERLRQKRDGKLCFEVLFLAHCTREKGLFDSLDGVALFNRRQPGARVHLTVAGLFMNEQEEREFHERIARPDLAGAVTYAGFVSGDTKNELLRKSDCLCFPTYYRAESFGLVIVEAMAYGIPSVVTRWRAIPELLPPDYPGFVGLRAPGEVADALERLVDADLAETLRANFLAHYSWESHLRQLADALKNLDVPADGAR